MFVVETTEKGAKGIYSIFFNNVPFLSFNACNAHQKHFINVPKSHRPRF